jgi:nucleotide-binding universal stress UspA family protein
MYKCIVLAYDGSESGQQALLECKDLAQWGHAQLWLVAVMPDMSMNYGALDGRERFKAILADGLRQLAEAGFEARGEVVTGESVEQISLFASKVQANLIVVGHKHLDSWAARWWRGSTSSAMIERAPCSVLCVITR